MPATRLHLFAYIPWDEQYLVRIPEEYRAFFSFVRPHLAVRTANVHTAIATSLLPDLVDQLGQPSSPRVLYLASILHDCGWSLTRPEDIADSLDYQGVAYTQAAAEAKFKHTIFGSALALKLIEQYFPDGQLPLGEKMLICDIVRYHETPQQYRANEPMPRELTLTYEADRLWQFTYEGFWLNTLRKATEPMEYLEMLTAEIDHLLMTDAAQAIARHLIGARRTEITDSLASLAHA